MASPTKEAPRHQPGPPPASAPAPKRPPPVPAKTAEGGATDGKPKPPSITETLGAGGPGEPLRPPVALQISKSLGANVQNVRVHTDANAAKAAKSMGARAFAVGTHIFLGPGERPTDMALMSHEVAHVLQQKGTPGPRVQLFSLSSNAPLEREAQHASTAVVQRQPFTVRGQTPARVQRLGIRDALDYFAEKAYLIPGYRMFTIIIGVNPINMSSTDRSAANILRAIIEFIPGGALITQALDNYGVFEKAGAWVETQIRSLGMTGAMFKQALDRFVDSLSWRDIFHLGDLWDRAKAIFTAPIARLIDFAAGLITGILRLIKDAILRPLARLAEGTRGWDLLIAVLGENPITGEPVPRTADTLIGGFMKLIGQEEVWNNIKRANAIPRAWAWFQGALAGVLAFVRQIPSTFIAALQSLELTDIVLLPRAFAKVGRVFASFIGNFLSWAGQQVLSLLQIIFEVVAPGAVPYIRKAAGAFRSIIQNPVGFIGNLVRAGIQGFRQFASNFLTHLRASLIQWLTGSLGGTGVYIPQAFEIREVIKFVLSVLGLTWTNIRSKLVRAVGERAVAALETGLDIVVTLVREGPAAAWEKIKEQLSNLKEMVMEGIMTFVRDRIVQAAITRLVTSLNPAGAFIQAIIAIYNTVMFFVERLRQIAQVAMSFIDSISAIASGAIGAAANRVEQTMAGLLTLVISFLARIVGLGRVSDAVKNIIDRIRAPIDRALDRVVEWIVTLGRRIGSAVAGGAQRVAARVVGWWRARKAFTATDRSSHALYWQGEGAAATLTVASGTPAPVNPFLVSIRSAATSSTDPLVRSNYTAAVALAGRIDRQRASVEGGPNPRQPTEVDQLNLMMEQLAGLLGPLVTIGLPAPTAAPTGSPVAVGELIKLTRSRQVAVVTALRPVSSVLMVNFRVISPRHERTTANLPSGFITTAFGTEFTKYVEDPRQMYLGSTPDRDSQVGQAVQARMQREGKLRVLPNGAKEVQPRGAPAGGPWVNIANCDMSHVIDAVTWWNSNGFLTGAQSPQVRAFMTNAINYELEPSGPNQARGAALAGRGVTYRTPAV